MRDRRPCSESVAGRLKTGVVSLDSMKRRRRGSVFELLFSSPIFRRLVLPHSSLFLADTLRIGKRRESYTSENREMRMDCRLMEK